MAQRLRGFRIDKNGFRIVLKSYTTSQTPTPGWWALQSVLHNILSHSLPGLCSINTLHAGVMVVRVVPIEGHPPMCSNTLITPQKPSDTLAPETQQI